ncbi:glycoside hydrolase family 2 protein [Aquihabitans sp. McL0605]|uniref:glycoside hydrolase family 2 protein n=1 Tax=Aquihabitans sp. McL0605 TaxID=3415671 RepID=UPI003CED90F3
MDGEPRPLGGWECASIAPGAIADAAALAHRSLDWLAAPVPGTAAAAVRDAGTWTLGDSRGFDDEDWWFRCRFAGPERGAGETWDLAFDGLATLADVWLNGRHLLRSENMFRSHLIPVGPLLEDDNELFIRFEALTPHLAPRRPRPAWKAAMVTSQSLRWIRTSFIGRTATWTPRVAPVGPWRPVELRRTPALPVADRTIRIDHDGTDGLIEATLVVAAGSATVRAATLTVDGHRAPMEVQLTVDGPTLTGTLRVPGAGAWWPATHGEQHRYRAAVTVTTSAGEHTIELGAVGFRSASFGPDHAPELVINGARIFCRGVTWMPLDLVGLRSDPAEQRRLLGALRAGGTNLVRIVGTTVDEPEAFLDLCDELGILVWHDLMFANLDYPAADPAFAAEVEAEVTGQLRRLQGHPCVVAVCGGSEIAQQAAMLARPLDQVSAAPLGKVLADLVAQHLPGVRFWPDSPTGGDPPFSVDTGIAHYFGVGGYRRAVSDARTSNVRFASECLAFSSVPDDDAVRSLRAAGVVVADPRWKAAVPRDAGQAWDHEDVRDHYVREQFGVDPASLRAVDPERYLDLGRAAVADLVGRTVAEWRRPGSTCAGAIVLQARDLVAGAGYGLFDVQGRPKSAWRALARVSSPTALLFIDEGLNGLDLYALNDRPEPVDGTLVVRAFAGSNCTAVAEVACLVPPRSSQRFRIEALLGEFLDVTYAYRFGVRQIDAVSARWFDGPSLVSRATFAPEGSTGVREVLGLSGTSRRVDDETYELDITTDRLARCILIGAPGADLSDDAFDLEPGGHALVRATSGQPVRFEVRAVNGLDRVRLEARDD